jgi:hypothetical protein
MAEAMPNRQPFRNGIPGSLRSPVLARPGQKESAGGVEPTGPPSGQDLLASDELLLQEINQLNEENRHLLSELGASRLSEAPREEVPELEKLLAENAELRCTIIELKQQLETAASPEERSWAEREKEYENILEEKSEVIRSLHLKIQELQAHREQAAPEQAPKAEHAALPNEDELQAVCDELERERAQLDAERHQMEQDRAQLQADEEALMKQMREMEMSMSRERAELARQRNELQRLHQDIQHALELASRDASLRDRLGPLQRRHQDISNRKGAAPAADHRPAAGRPPAPEAPAATPKRNESGLFRRLFGSG